MRAPIPTRIVESVRPERASPRVVEREFRARLEDGARLRPAGAAKTRPLRLLAAGYTPRHALRLFDTTYYLAGVRQNDDIRFFVGYVAQDAGGEPARDLYPRIFYKDVSLIWRSASHFIRTGDENWIGKGDLRIVEEDGEAFDVSDEATTNLPLEVQTAFEVSMRAASRIPEDRKAVPLVLRRAPPGRLEAYRDFTDPRRRAQADRRNLVNGGKSVARFTRRNDPTSLRFAKGYEPDFGRGILEVASSRSRLFGGVVRRHRILSTNREIQYLFLSGPRHVWIVPPQTLGTQLSSYGVRTVDVVADEDLFVPGYEYHFGEEHDDPSALFDQIPPGFAGEPSPMDPTRADTSRWLDQLPVIREFRRVVLGAGRRPG